MCCGFMAHVAEAAPTVPQQLVYNGHLFTPAGAPITTSHTIRFSIWNSSDFVVSDVSGGAINTGAATYLGWQEEHTVTPDANGYFSVDLGSITPLFSVVSLSAADLQSMFLQIEVKEAAAPTAAYEVLDINPTDATRDRTPVLSVPFALNADYLDQREIGTGSGDIALLSEGGVFSPSVIPEGTFKDAFTIDFDNTGTGDIVLEFGDTLGKTLVYDQVNSYFEFNDDVRIDGDLFVTGLINGVDITTLATPPASQLLAAADGALTVSITGGSYRINGVTTEYPGNSGIPVTDNTTNYVYFDATGLQTNTTGFPTNESSIRIATVVTSGGAITTVNDARGFLTDDREELEVVTLQPMFPQTTFEASGTDNVGALKLQYNVALDRNYYAWRSSRSSLQTYTVVTSIPLPNDFNGFDTTPLELDYFTDSASVADTNLAIEVLDSANATIALGGTSTGLASTSWSTTSLTFGGTPTLTPGDAITVKITAASRNGLDAAIGTLRLRYKTL